MKIFSLETKIRVAVWGLILGLVLDLISSWFTLGSYLPICSTVSATAFLGSCGKIYTFGFPWRVDDDRFLLKFGVDILFWIFVAGYFKFN